MLELRPSCEHCNIALPPESREARICSFECTFCADCVRDVLLDVCPNCGGGFAARPIRPRRNWRGANDLDHHPASTRVTPSAGRRRAAPRVRRADRRDRAARALACSSSARLRGALEVERGRNGIYDPILRHAAPRVLTRPTLAAAAVGAEHAARPRLCDARAVERTGKAIGTPPPSGAPRRRPCRRPCRACRGSSRCRSRLRRRRGRRACWRARCHRPA